MLNIALGLHGFPDRDSYGENPINPEDYDPDNFSP
jgi:hypothetical protein